MHDTSVDGAWLGDEHPRCHGSLPRAVMASLERAPIAAWVVCLPDRHVVWHNSHANEALGGAEGKGYCGARLDELLPANTAAAVAETLDGLERDGIRHRRSTAPCDGREPGAWELTWLPLDIGAGDVPHVLVYGRLLPTGARWLGAHAERLDPSGDPVYGGELAGLLTDESAQILSLTEAACTLLGRSADELLGLRVPDLLREPDTGEELLRSAQEAGSRPVSGWVTLGDPDPTAASPVPGRRVAVGVINRLGQRPLDALLWHKLPIDDPPINAARKAHTGEYAAFLERRLSEIAKEVERAGLAIRSHGAPPARLLPGLERLSDREREVLDLLTRGLRVPTIAERLFVSQSTVRNHVSALFRKLGVQSQAELIERVLDPDEDTDT